MRKRAAFAALSLSAAAAVASDQAPKPAPAEERSAPPAAPAAPRLNLRLDNPGGYARETPREGAADAALPALGGDARTLPARTLATPLDGPFPKDSDRGER
ncbi:MAG TPA: hypothetical protein VFB93_12035 [Burkholderiales bacterium]|nr:hypothetical protein [Burkholderiales bacterium]